MNKDNKFSTLGFKLQLLLCFVICSADCISDSSFKFQVTPAYLKTSEELNEIRKNEDSTIILIGRHGRTDSNRKGLTHQDGSNENINIKNQDDTEDIVYLSKIGEKHLVNGLYCAPSHRCQTTSALMSVGSMGDLQVIPDERFKEQDFGNLKGKSPEQYLNDKEFLRLVQDADYKMESNGGESTNKAISRLLNGIIEYADANIGKAIYICVSRGCIAALERFINGKKYKNKNDVITLYSPKNYNILVIRYYNKSKTIELVYEDPMVPKKVYKFLKSEKNLQKEAGQLLEQAKKNVGAIPIVG